MKIPTVELKAARKNGIVRICFVGLSVIIELFLLISGFLWLKDYWAWASSVVQVLAVVSVLAIYSKHTTSSMKMPWIILILVFPIPGLLLFGLIGQSGSTKKMAKRYDDVDKKLYPYLPKDDELMEELYSNNSDVFAISSYIRKYAKYPVYKNTDVIYYDDASKGLEAMLEAMRNAEKFIFMEYFAIEDLESWKRIQDVLEERVSKGVEVRVFYDDVGSIGFINTNFVKKLEAVGIKCRVFNPVKLAVNLFINNRDHRKITVIDGKVAFTGGFNIANEYFNITHPYGMWKDAGVRLEGDAVRSFTVMCLEMWNASNPKDQDDTEFDKYFPTYDYKAVENGFIQPYCDSPIDNEHVGEEVYISIINKATKYCYFITPYLIITDEMIHALSLAAKRGVDVRIITPGIPDKKVAYSLTRSFYNVLVRNGVRVYEWSPGFCHCKLCVADDSFATCGTINMDYRSLYHHFEDGVFMHDCNAVLNIKDDILKTINECRDVTEKYKKGRSNGLRLGQMFLRLFAELM